jgi:hypothetical protein
MNKKIEYLKKVAKPIKSKVSLAQMADLNSIIEKLKSYDIQTELYAVEELYENAVNEAEKSRLAANQYIEKKTDLYEITGDHWDIYTEASELYQEITNQLYELGVEPSPELEAYGDILAQNEQLGQETYSEMENGFNMHNELVDISDFN